MTGVVITYLNYGDFETQLSKRVIPQVQHGAIPTKVVSSVLDSSSIQKLALRLLKSQEPSSIDVSKVLAKEGQYSKMQPTSHFYFLLYARLYWAEHILRDPKQDPAMYRSLGRALDRNILVMDMRDDYGQTPLSRAAQRGYEAMVRLLLEKGAAIESKDDGSRATGGLGRNPLLWAAERGHEAVVRLLLEKGAAIESKDYMGWTPLSLAAKRGDEAMVRLLLEKGALIESNDSFGLTPLSWAAERRHEAVVRLLKSYGARSA
ncbi:hypothetical protein NW767_015738 [Fusarium falciforme]|nr:hypothetical protein NW767_015738 [Fusarium falciforme]